MSRHCLAQRPPWFLNSRLWGNGRGEEEETTLRGNNGRVLPSLGWALEESQVGAAKWATPTAQPLSNHSPADTAMAFGDCTVGVHTFCSELSVARSNMPQLWWVHP